MLAAGAAYATGLGCVMIRKPGKLPRPVITEDYELEYGTATLEVHPDELAPGTRVLLLDDVLATGGTLAASCRLAERAGWRVAGISVVLELSELHGVDKLPLMLNRRLVDAECRRRGVMVTSAEVDPGNAPEMSYASICAPTVDTSSLVLARMYLSSRCVESVRRRAW